MADLIPGEERAWEMLSGMVPSEVCARACVSFDDSANRYTILSFGKRFAVDTGKKEITHIDPEGELFLKRLGYFFRLSVLWYLVRATEAGPSGKLIKPSGMPGGDIFFRGTHVLPLDSVARKYRADREGFLAKGRDFGARETAYGDASVEINPLPKIPVTVVLWLADEEWDARADLLFDANSLNHLPIDILWSVAMMSVLVFL
jgi:hypothetical protein